MDGIINVYKEAGFTSHDVVAKLRGILHQKKIGHTGTLDPAATGVLPVCLGKATKVCELLTDKDKTYQAVCKLGVVTDTQDMTGEILKETPTHGLTEEEICRTVASFQGDSLQLPPMYSALKVDGRKLYELAREGKEVERKPRPIRISNIEIRQMALEEQTFTMGDTCSKGTYIRTLCHDIGQKLGVGAAMQSLVRTRVADFFISDAMTLDTISNLFEGQKERFMEKIRPIDSLFPAYPRLMIKAEYARKLANGNILYDDYLQPYQREDTEQTERLSGESREEEKYLIYDENGEFKAIYRRSNRDFTVIKMF